MLDQALLLTYRELQSLSGEGEATLCAELEALKEVDRILPVASGFAAVDSLTWIEEEMNNLAHRLSSGTSHAARCPKSGMGRTVFTRPRHKRSNSLLEMWEERRNSESKSGETIALHSFRSQTSLISGNQR